MKVINSIGVVVRENVFVTRVFTKTDFLEYSGVSFMEDGYEITDELWEEFCDEHYDNIRVSELHQMYDFFVMFMIGR